MLHYDTKALDDYRPLFSWNGSFLHARTGAGPLWPSALEAAVSQVHALSAHAQWETARVCGLWVSLELSTPPPVAMCLAPSPAVDIDRALLYLGSRVRGVMPWYSVGLLFGVHRLRRAAVPRRLIDSYGSLRRMDADWEHNMDVRACYETWWFPVTAVLGPDYCCVEVPDASLFTLSENLAVRRHARTLATQWLDRVGDLLGVSFPDHAACSIPVAARRSAHRVLESLAVGFSFASGSVRVLSSKSFAESLLVWRHVGDFPPAAAPGKAMQAVVQVETEVPLPNDEGLIEQRVRPPRDRKSVQRFNEHFCAYPHRLFSLEIRRVQSVLETMQRVATDLDALLAEGPSPYAAATWWDHHTGLPYYSADPTPWCLRPLPHIWQEVT